MNQDPFAAFGTGFDPLEDDQKDGVPKPKSIYDQVATDERGRRRFHGAFTGGFSAGFFNSVGSKKGWYPQVFKSSRDERHDRFQQMPEDFMDAEDLGEFGIASRKIRQTANFRNEDSNKRMAWEHPSAATDALAAQLEQLVRPVSDSIGVRMLREMGWRQGRGIGLETTKEKANRGHNEDDRSEIRRVAKGADLSVEDSLVQTFKSVEGLHGLGYTGLQSTSILDEKFGQSSSAFKGNKKGRGISGQAFGVGVFEDEDENVYTNFDLSQYDFALDGPGKAPEAGKVDSNFTISTGRVPPRKFFPPPKIPANYKPVHKPLPMDQSKLPQQVQKTIERLHPVQRAKILGLDRINFMEAVADKDRVRLRNRGERGSRWDIKPKAEGEPEAFAIRVAFPDEPMKQRRFKEFLYYLKRGLPYPQPTDMSVWEWENEKKEFEEQLSNEERGMLPEVRSRMQPLAKTALAMPLQELLQSKFVSEKGDSGKGSLKDEDKMAAVKMGMFGTRTRTTYEWRPHKTIAKMFNVPNPFPGSHYVGCAHLQKEDRPKETIINLGLPNTQAELAFKDQQMRERMQQSHDYRDSIKRETIDLDADDATASTTEAQQKEQEVKWERPPMDLFEAIFAEAEEEEEEVEETKEVENEQRNDPIPFNMPTENQGFVLSKGVETPPGSPSTSSAQKEEKEEAIGPQLPPTSDDPNAISVATVYKYLRETLKEKKEKKSKDKEKEKERSKKSKSKKEKKEKKKKRKHHKKHDRSRKSSESSTGDSSEVQVLSD